VSKPSSEEVRKVQLTGRSSYIISLPKRWVEDMSIRPGDRISFLRQGNSSLILVPSSQPKFEGRGEFAVDISPREEANSIVRRIISLYLVGSSLISVRANGGRISSAQREVIKDVAKRKLIGAEIVGESSQGVLIQVLLSYPELSVENALKRMATMAMSMHRDAVLALEELDRDLCNQIISMDDEVDRFSLYIIRQLKFAVQNQRLINEIGLREPRDCLGYRLITNYIEGAADHAVEMAENIVTIHDRPERQVLERIRAMSTKVCSVFEDSIKAIFERDYRLGDGVVARARNMAKTKADVAELITRYGRRDAPSLRLIMESLRRTAEAAGNIGEVVLNMTVFSMPKGKPQPSRATS